jgi:hypothetical protein
VGIPKTARRHSLLLLKDRFRYPGQLVGVQSVKVVSRRFQFVCN